MGSNGAARCSDYGDGYMSFRSALLDYLETDTTLTDLLTGGIYAAQEIKRQATPDAFDSNLEIRPCCLIKLETDVRFGPHYTSSRLFFTLYFYQRVGFDVIDQAKDRAFAILHRACGVASYEIWHADDINDQEDQALECSLVTSRYFAVRVR